MKHVVLAVVIGLCGCKKEAPRAVVPPSMQEAEAFAKDFATKLAPCDAAAVDRMVDLDLLIERAVGGQADDNFMTGFKRGFGTFGNMFCKQLTALDAQLTYLRTQQEAGVPRPLLRQISQGGVNYYQLELDKRQGVTRLVDLYIFMSGEKISETLGNAMSALGRTGMGWGPKLKEIREHMQAGRWEEANKLYASLPANLRKTKASRLIELEIATELGDEPYLKALNEYAQAFPNDPSLALVAIDRAILRKEYDTATKYLNDLDTRVGGDPYLDVLRSNTLLMAGKSDEALAAAKRASEREPGLAEVWWQLLTVQAAGKRHADAIATLTVLRDKFKADVTPDTLAGDERFGELAVSPEYRAWASGDESR